jgi:hypothetical protein
VWQHFVLHCTVPSMVAIASALMRQGYRVSRSHTDPTAIKTDAPARALWDVLRCWVASQPPRKKGLSETSPAHALLATAPIVQADFTPTKQAQELLTKRTEDGAKLGRFMPNPDEWGPGSRATSHAAAFGAATSGAADDDGAAAAAAGPGGAQRGAMLEKRARHQGKRTRKRQAREAREAAAWEEGEEGGGEDDGGEEAAGEAAGGDAPMDGAAESASGESKTAA